MQHRSYYVYIMTNRSKTLYSGVTNNLYRRVRQHKQGDGSEFCARYRLDRLVYFERFRYVGRAIAREKEIKGWLRVKKSALIVAENPAWRDLSEAWYLAVSFRKGA
jgi:putative endonuclease